MTSSHMTFDELKELYRTEMNGSALSPPRKDLYPAMRDLLERLRREQEKQSATDPDSVLTEGAEHRRKSAVRLCREVTRIRATKICNMAFLGALGSKNSIDMLTVEETGYYHGILGLSMKHLDLCKEPREDYPKDTASEKSKPRSVAYIDMLGVVTREWKTTQEYREIMESKGFDPLNVASALNYLKKKGLVEKDPDGRRASAKVARWRLKEGSE